MYMTAGKDSTSSGDWQAAKPRKLLASGVDPSVGKATQFKPGQSGNPRGPKKGYKHINTIIQELVNDENFEATLIDLKKGIFEYKGAPIKAIVKALINEAVAAKDANVRKAAREQLLKYGWPTKSEITGEDGAPVVALGEIIRGKPAESSD